MSKMKAVVKAAAEPGAVFQSVDIPEPGPGEVLVKVKATAICGTDVHIYAWNEWARKAVRSVPQVMGHEFSGEVVKTGSAVKTLSVGDRVSGETHGPCGKCYQCMNGQQHICANMNLFGVHCNGCFAQYALLTEICARKIPEEIPWEFGAMMEPLGTSVRAAQEVVCSGSNVAVIGCGPIGLGVVTALKAMGAYRIIVTDVSEDRLVIAKELGATDLLNPMNCDVVSSVMEITEGVGVDAFIDASGNVKAIADGFKFLRKGGRVALIGLPSKTFEIDLVSDVIFKEAKIIGIHGRKMFETWTVMENLMAGNLLNLKPIMTHVLPLEQFEKGFQLLKEGKACKVILDPWVEG